MHALPLQMADHPFDKGPATNYYHWFGHGRRKVPDTRTQAAGQYDRGCVVQVWRSHRETRTHTFE